MDALHVTNLVVGCCELLLERRVARRFDREAVEILERLRDDEIAGGRRSREIDDGVVELEQE